MKYKFIVVEGFDGSGKSTIAKWLADTMGYEYHKTPMGIFAKLRSHFDQEDSNLQERYCFYAADCMRASLYIQEQLNKGQPIVLDRYYYSTISYHESKQPGISKLLPGIFQPLLKPDLILYIKTNYQLTLKRMQQRQNLADDELFLTEEHYDKIHQTFLQLFDVQHMVVDNTASLEESCELVKKTLTASG
ncbi:MAG: dTMP kinase [Spirochaetota bacterium]